LNYGLDAARGWGTIASALVLILWGARRERAMAVDQPAGTAEERAAAALIAAAVTLLGGKQGSPPKEFVTDLFARAVPEDLLRYEARDVAAVAEAAWSFLATRKPGAAQVRCSQPPRTAPGNRSSMCRSWISSTTTCRSSSTL